MLLLRRGGGPSPPALLARPAPREPPTPSPAPPAAPRPCAPPQLCPTNTAFNSFATASGFANWGALSAAAEAAPGLWRPYLQRLWDYHRLPDTQLSMASISSGKSGPYETALVLTRDADGNPLTRAALSAERTGTSARVVFVTPGKQRVTITGADVASIEGVVAVHAVGAVIMPPDTFHTLARALRGNTQLRMSVSAAARLRLCGAAAPLGRRHLRLRRAWLCACAGSSRLTPPSPSSAQATYMAGGAMRAAMNNAGTGGTVVAPLDTAWKGMRWPTKPPPPTWPGGATGSAISTSAPLKAALSQYLTVRVPARGPELAGGFETLTRERLVALWQQAGGPGLMALPTALTVAGDQQQLYYTYDRAADKLYIVGGRNTASTPMMAGGELGARVLYAGTATLLTAGGAAAPLPLRTGVAKFDAQPLPPWY